MNLQYPIDKYIPQEYSVKLKNEWLSDIKLLPNNIENAIKNFDNQQLQTPYREGGWTVHQLVHHVADSHINAYIRFKLGLTENNPTIKPYDENEWAKLNDIKNLPVWTSIILLFALHKRWHSTLKNISDEEWKKTIYHPEYKKEMTLWYLLGFYSWHGKHHVAHITRLKERMEW